MFDIKRNKKAGTVLGICGIVLFTAVSCMSSGSSETTSPPDWVINPPQSNDDYSFFVGSASEASGDEVVAEENAVNSLVGEITRYIGVKVTSSSSAQAKATLDDFSTSVTETVKSEGTAQISGFQVVDRYVRTRDDGTVQVYVLGRYETEALEKEKKRIAAAFKEIREAISGPEKEGDSHMTFGEPFQALVKYLEAGAAAAGADVENADIKFERIMNKARQALGSIRIEAKEHSRTVMAGEAFPEPFVAQLKGNGSDFDDTVLKNVPIKVSYPVKKRNGRMGSRSKTLQSNAEGELVFEAPAPDYVGKEEVSMSLDMAAYFDPLYELPNQFIDQIQSLEQLLSDVRVDFDFEVQSNAPNIPTGIVILDTDTARKPYAGNNTASGVMESLSGAGFRVRTLGYDASQLLSMGDNAFIREIQSQFGSAVDRVIFGVVTLADYNESGSVTVKAQGSLKVADLDTGEILYTERLIKRARAASAQSAIKMAFRQLGADGGKKMINSLP